MGSLWIWLKWDSLDPAWAGMVSSGSIFSGQRWDKLQRLDKPDQQAPSMEGHITWIYLDNSVSPHRWPRNSVVFLNMQHVYTYSLSYVTCAAPPTTKQPPYVNRMGSCVPWLPLEWSQTNPKWRPAGFESRTQRKHGVSGRPKRRHADRTKNRTRTFGGATYSPEKSPTMSVKCARVAQ